MQRPGYLAARRRHLKAVALVTVLAASLALASCSGDPAEPGSTVTATADASANKSAAPAPVVPTAWPLTGIASDDIAIRPAIAVKIENSREARPQTGLEAADVVWEEMVEGGITRYIAVYHSQLPETIGPIRSVRPMDANLIAPLRGLMVFSGGQAPFVNAVGDVGLQVVSHDQGAAGFYRAKDRKAPHNVYGTPATFLSLAGENNKATPAVQFVFARDAASATAAVSGTPVAAVNVVMSSYAKPNWAWDAATGKFLRSEMDKPAVNAAGTQLSATNVVVLTMGIFNTPYVDPAGTPVPETEVIGSGAALVVTGGKQVTGTWSKADAASPMLLTAADGTTITLAPGNTWVELVPNTTGSYTTS